LIGKDKINNEIIDTLSLSREKFPGSSVSLDSLCKRYGIDNSRRKQHTALIDCDLLARVYINLIDQKEPTLNFLEENIKDSANNTAKVSYYKKIVLPTKEEIEKHKNYLKNSLKKNYFN